jgi:hypothetical protein
MSMRGRRIALLMGLGVLGMAAGAWLGERPRTRSEGAARPAPGAGAGAPWPGHEARALGPADLAAPGGRALLWFWASWCAHCAASAAGLRVLAEARWRLWGVLAFDTPARAGDALRRWAVPYDRLAVDDGGAMARAWGVRGVPTGFVLGADG